MKVRELIELLKTVDQEASVELEIDMHWNSAAGINVDEQYGRIDITDAYDAKLRPPAEPIPAYR